MRLPLGMKTAKTVLGASAFVFVVACGGEPEATPAPTAPPPSDARPAPSPAVAVAPTTTVAFVQTAVTSTDGEAGTSQYDPGEVVCDSSGEDLIVLTRKRKRDSD